MGHDHLRDDKECQNCGHIVEEIYCPHCGQKNTETRQSFGHLVGHFLEDLTHYDGAFWKTIKYLLFRPAFLTKEYLMGKRQLYVPPVKLYIFISFLTFLILAILPEYPEQEDTSKKSEDHLTVEQINEVPVNLRDKENVWIKNITVKGNMTLYNPMSYRSEMEMYAIEQLKPDSLRLSPMERVMGGKLIKLYSHNTPEQVGEKFSDSFSHNIPKIIFIYMPIFAFWLWIFHSKKRWYFFDHGIFTLHYFAFLLLNMTFILVLSNYTVPIKSCIGESMTTIILTALFLCSMFWQVYYFYRAHHKMYHESLIVNFIKSTLMFIINIISILLISIAAAYFTLYNLH